MQIRGVFFLFLIAVVGGLADKGLVSQSVGITMRDLMVILSYAYFILIGLRVIKEFLLNKQPFSLANNLMFERIDIGMMFLSVWTVKPCPSGRGYKVCYNI